MGPRPDGVPGVPAACTPADCDDGDPCTADACQGCQQGACQGGIAKVCADDQACTADSCDPGFGCVFLPSGPSCIVADPCANPNCGWASQFVAKTYGGAGDETARAIVKLADGFALLMDSTTNGQSAWLARTDLNGTKLWDRTYGGAGDDRAAQFVPVPGGFALFGTTPSVEGWLLRTDLFGNATRATSGSCIAKLASDGNACTSDRCDAAHAGCWHDTASLNTCDDGLICTPYDDCGSASQCVLRDRGTPGAANSCTGP